MNNLKLIFSTGLIAACFLTVGLLNPQVQAPTQTYKVSVGKQISQQTNAPMKALDLLIRQYAATHGHYPQSLEHLNTDTKMKNDLADLNAQFLHKVGFLDAQILLQSQIEDRHLLAGQFTDGLVIYQVIHSEKHPTGYRILRSNRLGDLLARQNMPLAYSNWLEPGKYLNLSIEAHRHPIIVS